jgi:hypothetical protein
MSEHLLSATDRKTLRVAAEHSRCIGNRRTAANLDRMAQEGVALDDTDMAAIRTAGQTLANNGVRKTGPAVIDIANRHR